MNFALQNIILAAESPDNTLENVTTVLWLLIAVAVVAVLTKYIKLPYTIVLVLVGIAIAIASPSITKSILSVFSLTKSVLGV